MPEASRHFSASLSTRAKLVTYGVGFGVGLGVPVILAVAFGIAFGTPLPLILPLLFGTALLLAWAYRTVGYRVDADAITVLRPAGGRRFALAAIADVRFPAAKPPGAVFGLWRVDGIFGSHGVYWNKAWGRFRVFVTNDANRVEIRLRDGGRVLLSPDDPAGFVAAVRALLPQP